MNRRLELSRVDQIENLAGRKKNENLPKNYDTATGSAAIMTDTVQISEESQALANSVKADNDNKVAPIQKNVNENVLIELLKKTDKQSGIFGLSEGISRTIEQENSDNKPGGKIDILL